MINKSDIYLNDGTGRITSAMVYVANVASKLSVGSVDGKKSWFTPLAFSRRSLWQAIREFEQGKTKMKPVECLDEG